MLEIYDLCLRFAFGQKIVGKRKGGGEEESFFCVDSLFLCFPKHFGGFPPLLFIGVEDGLEPAGFFSSIHAFGLLSPSSLMASDSLLSQIHHLFNRFSTLLTAKVSDLVVVLSNHKNAGSIGALAGLAIAIVFTWKFLKGPDRHRRRQPKRRGASSNIGAGNQSHNVAPSSEETHLLNARSHTEIEEFHPPMKLSLSQSVRKKLNGGKKMTCQLLGVILEESTPEELQKHATVRPSVVEVLLTISKYCDLYLMERILDDESSERILSALDNAGLFATGGLNKDKVLFCGTENGRTSFVRQLEPDWHVDSSSEIVSQLARFIRNQLHVSPAGSSYMSPNIFSSISLEQYFSNMDQN